MIETCVTQWPPSVRSSNSQNKCVFSLAKSRGKPNCCLLCCDSFKTNSKIPSQVKDFQYSKSAYPVVRAYSPSVKHLKWDLPRSLSLSVFPALCASLFRVGHQIWQCVASRVTPSPFWAVNSVFAAAAISGSVFGQTKPSKVSLMWRFFALFLLLQFELKFTAYGG